MPPNGISDGSDIYLLQWANNSATMVEKVRLPLNLQQAEKTVFSIFRVTVNR
jgi:hypothetical protein